MVGRLRYAITISVACFGLNGAGCGIDGLGVLDAGPRFFATGPDVVPRYFHRASLLGDGRVLVSGGLTVRVFPPTLVTVDTLSFFDPASRTFSTAFQPAGGAGVAPLEPRLHLARSSHSQTTLVDGRVLFAGGDTGAEMSRAGLPTATCEIFDPATGAVDAGPSMNEARSFHTATVLADGRVVVAGGATWQAFDPATDAWSAAVPLARARLRHAAVPLSGHFGDGLDGVLLVGGSSAGDTMELLDPHAMTATLYAARLPVGVSDLAAARLEDGRVLIAGGQRSDSGDTVADTLLFDPATGELTPLAPPPGAPRGFGDHVMVTLGRHVVVFGGEEERGDADTELRRALVFDVQALAWSGELNTHFTHDDFPAVKLDDRRVLLVGGGTGLFGLPAPTANAELFVAEFDP